MEFEEDKHFNIFMCGAIVGMFIMGLIMRIAFATIPEFYGDRCLNSTEYRIDTVKTYHDGEMNVEYKFVNKYRK